MQEFENLVLVKRVLDAAENTSEEIHITEDNVYSLFQCNYAEFTEVFNALQRCGLLLPRNPSCLVISGVTLLKTLLDSH